MNMKKSAFISDVIFAFAAAFLPALCLFRYRGLSLPLSVLTAALAGGLSAALIYALLHKKRERLCLKKRDEENRDKLLLHLALQGEKANSDYFLKFFKTKVDGKADGQAGENARGTAELKRLKGVARIETETENFYPLFTLCPLDADKIAPVLYGEGEKRKCLLCSGLTEEAQKLCARFDVRTITGNEVYLMLKKEDFLPEHYLGDDARPPQKKKRLHAWFAKSNSRRFLSGGTLILLTSLITPFPLYYLILGSALILSAVFVRIFGYR